MSRYDRGASVRVSELLHFTGVVQFAGTVPRRIVIVVSTFVMQLFC